MLKIECFSVNPQVKCIKLCIDKNNIFNYKRFFDELVRLKRKYMQNKYTKCLLNPKNVLYLQRLSENASS